MRLISLASGSSGNCIYIGDDNTHILIDAGISRKRIESALNEIDLTLKDIDAILVTHEHIDHTGGLGVISRKEAIPIYATEGTIRGIKEMSGLGEIDGDLFCGIRADESFWIEDFHINPFKIYHDAYEPCAYTVECGGKKAGVITDLGKYDDYIVDNLKGVNALLAEANHDIHMLEAGPYPYPLKMRILGDRGHLSNDACARMLGRVLNDNIAGIMLGHLSKENNYADLALMTVNTEIDLNDTEYKAGDFNIEVARRDGVTAIKEF